MSAIDNIAGLLLLLAGFTFYAAQIGEYVTLGEPEISGAVMDDVVSDLFYSIEVYPLLLMKNVSGTVATTISIANSSGIYFVLNSSGGTVSAGNVFSFDIETNNTRLYIYSLNSSVSDVFSSNENSSIISGLPELNEVLNKSALDELASASETSYFQKYDNSRLIVVYSDNSTQYIPSSITTPASNVYTYAKRTRFINNSNFEDITLRVLWW